MAGYCVFGWLFTKQKRQIGALSIDVADDRGETIAGYTEIVGAISPLGVGGD